MGERVPLCQVFASDLILPCKSKLTSFTVKGIDLDDTVLMNLKADYFRPRNPRTFVASTTKGTARY